MTFFKAITDCAPTKQQVVSALLMSTTLGIGVGFTTLGHVLLNINNPECVDAGLDNVSAVMMETTFKSLVLTLGLAGLIQAQKAFGIEPTSSIVGAECSVVLAVLCAISSKADKQIPINQCSTASDNYEEQRCELRPY